MRRARASARARLAALCLLLAAPLAARDDDVAAFDDQLEVSLVSFEVVVHDRDGQPVIGLGADDFELRRDGERIPIAHFAAVEGRRLVPVAADREAGQAASAVPAPAAARSREDRLNLVLYLDRAHLQPGELEGAVDTLRAFVRSALERGDRAMLVEANHDLDVLQPPTAVAELILAQLDALRPTVPRGRAASDFAQLLTEIERAAQGGPDIMARDRNQVPRTLKTQIDNFTVRTYQELARTTNQLHRLIPALAGLPGRKAMVYVGGTLPTDAGRNLYNVWRRAFGTGSAFQQERGQGGNDPFAAAIDLGGLAPEADTGPLIEAVAERANASGVTLHVIDVGGLRRGRGFMASSGAQVTNFQSGGQSSGGRIDPGRRLGDPQSLKSMAELTGGQALINSRSFERALETVGRDLDTYYTLAFRPPPDDGDGLHRIAVKLDRRHRRLQVRHRGAYRGRDADRQAAEQVVAALLLGEVSNPLDLEVKAGAPSPAAEGGVATVAVTFTLPLAKLSLLAERRAHRGQLSIYLTSGSIAAGAAQVQKQVVPIRIANDQLQTSLGRRVEHTVALPIRAGSGAVAVAVRDDFRPLVATAALPLPAAAAPAAPPAPAPSPDSP